MRIPTKKVYGETHSGECPFCGRQPTTRNWQNVPVCKDHQDKEIPGLKCVCGEWLDLKVGKFGPYFHCVKCGNINFKKGLDYNSMAIGAILERSPLLDKKQHKQMQAEPSNGSDTDDINRRIREEIERAIRGDD